MLNISRGNYNLYLQAWDWWYKLLDQREANTKPYLGVGRGE